MRNASLTKIKREITAVEKSIAEKVRQYRMANELNQGELAEALTEQLGYKIYQSTITDIEAAALRVHGHMLIAMSDVLNCDVSDLLPLGNTTSLSDNAKLISRLNQINELPTSDQATIISIIDAFLTKQ